MVTAGELPTWGALLCSRACIGGWAQLGMGNDQWWLMGGWAWVVPGPYLHVHFLGVASEFADKRYCQKMY